MKPDLQIFPDAAGLGLSLAQNFMLELAHKSIGCRPFTAALSGGSTPAVFFSALAAIEPRNPLWALVHFFWVDERCVPPENPASNYGMAWERLLGRLPIPSHHLHRIRGEEEPVREAERYGGEIRSHAAIAPDGWPLFDWLMLGLGEDGHTASLFPGAETIDDKTHLCVVAEHPLTHQKRITLTLPVINHAQKVVFLVSGGAKADVLAAVIKGDEKSSVYPAARVKPVSGCLQWYLDKEAASRII